MANNFFGTIGIAFENLGKLKSDARQVSGIITQLTETPVKVSPFLAPTATSRKELKDSINKINDSLKKGSPLADQFGKAMKRALVVAPVWMIMRGVIQGTFSALQALPAAAIAWEKEMAQIKRVGKGTSAEYEILSTRLLDLAKTYGVASSTMGQGAALWAQQGKTLSEIAPLMETTIKLSLITGKTVSESVEDITAIMKSYKIEAQDTTSILDKLIKVEQEHAITTNVLTDAAKKAAPVAAQFGISFEKFLGIVTATHVATRAAGGEIGNAWKTIFARMATSAIPAIQNIAKVPVYMDAAGKATYENTGTFRSWGNILDEVMVSMGSLNEVQQTSLANALAMKRTINYLLSAYQNWDEGIKATIESLDSFGTADKSIGVLLGTTASKTIQLQSAWSELGVTIVNNGQFIKDTVDLLKNLVSGVNTLALAFRGYTGQELISSKANKEGVDKLAKVYREQLGQLKSMVELKKLLGETKEFETRIKEEPKWGEDQKNKILSIIQQRQKFIEETIAKQPEIEGTILGKEAVLIRGEELQKVRDEITALSIEAYAIVPKGIAGYQLKMGGLLSDVPIKQLENKLKTLKNIKPEITIGQENEFNNAIIYLEKIIKLRKQEAEISDWKYLIVLENRLKNEKDFEEASKEYQENTAELTREQTAQLNLARELSTFSIQIGITAEQILQKKIELLKVSEQFNNEQSRTLALEQAQNQLIEVRLQKRKQEEETLLNLGMQYEKADMFEKERIRRIAELRTMKPTELAANYQNLGLDKKLIEDYFSTFNQEQQDAVSKTTELYREMKGQLSGIAAAGNEEYWLNEQIKAAKLWQGQPQFISPISAAGNQLINNYIIPSITLEGAITDGDIQGLLDEIDKKMKAQPNYIGNGDLIGEISKDSVKKKKLADTLRGEM